MKCIKSCEAARTFIIIFNILLKLLRCTFSKSPFDTKQHNLSKCVGNATNKYQTPKKKEIIMIRIKMVDNKFSVLIFGTVSFTLILGLCALLPGGWLVCFDML